MTSVIMLFIKFVLRIPLRMSDDQLLIGDDAIHGEDAYAFGDVSYTVHQVDHPMQIGGSSELGIIQEHSQNNVDETKY